MINKENNKGGSRKMLIKKVESDIISQRNFHSTCAKDVFVNPDGTIVVIDQDGATLIQPEQNQVLEPVKDFTVCGCNF